MYTLGQCAPPPTHLGVDFMLGTTLNGLGQTNSILREWARMGRNQTHIFMEKLRNWSAEKKNEQENTRVELRYLKKHSVKVRPFLPQYF